VRPSPSTGLEPEPREERLLHGILRDALLSWPAPTDAAFERRFLDACHEHGVAALVHHHVKPTPVWQDWPVAVREGLARETAMQAALDMLREHEVVAVLEGLHAAGIETVLLKGTPLAYSHYAAPALRPRCDTDLLIPAAGRAATERVLKAMGYVRPNTVRGRLVSYQESFHRKAGRVDHVVDVHWRINNSQVFAEALSFDAAFARSVAVPKLGPAARALCPPHALLLACMHRAAHLYADGGDGNRLIWLHDIHLLANAMTAEEWQQFQKLCTAAQMRRICLDAFAATHRAFATVLPDPLLKELAAASPRELSAEYLHARRWRILLTDLRALATWRDRATLLGEACFPDADYVLARYGAHNRRSLPWLYLRRAIAGIGKLSGLGPVRAEQRLDADAQ
jgi:hypothetical protein